MSNTEQTLSIIKPDATERNLQDEIKKEFKKKGFLIVNEKKIHISKTEAEQMAFTKQILQQRIAEHTGQSIETIETDSDRDRWFTAEEASDYGIIDKVIVRRGEMH